MCWSLFKIIGLSQKNLDPSQKTLRHLWCPKLVTGLNCVKRSLSESVAIFSQVWKSYCWCECDQSL